MSWAEIKKALNGTVGTSNFKPLNEIILNQINSSHGQQVFTSNGTFNVPSGISAIRISAIASGANGHSFGSGGGYNGGNSGEEIHNAIFYLDGKTSIPITVGQGNTVVGDFLILTKGNGTNKGGASNYNNNSDGSTISGGGGAAGMWVTGNGNQGKAGGYYGGSGAGPGAGSGGGPGLKGGDATYPAVGGAKGGNGCTTSGYSAKTGGGGAGGGYGAGGGGGACVGNGYSYGGAGANGIVIIEW